MYPNNIPKQCVAEEPAAQTTTTQLDDAGFRRPSEIRHAVFIIYPLAPGVGPYEAALP